MVKSRRTLVATFGVMLLSLALWPGCSCSSDESLPATTAPGTGGGAGGGGGGGATTTSSQGAGGVGGAGGSGGSAGAQPAAGVQSTDSVSAGNVVQSPGYVMVFTFGQPTQHQGKATSPSYRMQGGLVGANGSLP